MQRRKLFINEPTDTYEDIDESAAEAIVGGLTLSLQDHFGESSSSAFLAEFPIEFDDDILGRVID